MTIPNDYKELSYRVNRCFIERSQAEERKKRGHMQWKRGGIIRQVFLARQLFESPM